jgi:hypothetical protein
MADEGQLVCKNHGGRTPAALETAKQRRAYEEVLVDASRIVGLQGHLARGLDLPPCR